MEKQVENTVHNPTAIGRKELETFRRALEQYRAGKRNLDSRIVEAEEFWKLRHWRSIRPNNPGEPEPASGWLVNTILSKHSDAVDAYPEPVCLAREESDQTEAEALSSILPVVLQQNDFAQVWSDVWWYKLKSGTGVYGVFWDTGKLGGMGDIAIEKVDILNLFWEPGVRDIQKSKYLFHVILRDKKELEETWPQLKNTWDTGAAMVRQYRQDEAFNPADKAAVVDVYYKKKGILHYCKYVGETVLYATENDPHFATRGLYDHGRYPFIFDALFPEEGYPGCGYGYVDLCRDPQTSIDILNNCMLQNAVAAATPRWFVRLDGGVNEAEYADMTKKFVHVAGRMDEDSVKQIVTQPMPQSSLTYMQMKINEMKEVSGNRDVNNGGTASAVTAASAIAALQEAGNGLSRDMIAASYRAFRKVVELSIELIRQFYTLPRRFRIMGQYGTARYIAYANDGLLPKTRDGGLRLPVFDIQVEVQAETQYKKQTYNDLAVQLYQLGIFDPQRADQALMMLGMMDFKGKTELVRQIAQGRQQQLLRRALEHQAAQSMETAQPGMSAPEAATQREHPYMEKARANAGSIT